MVPPRDKPDPVPAPETNSEKRSGRVSFDDRGNSVWEWQVDTGVYSRDVNTQKVRKLELDELSLEDTSVHRQVEIEDQRKPTFNKAQAGGGFNPYDNSPSVQGKGPDPYNRARAAAERIHGKPAPAPEKKKPATDLRRLSDWIKLKRAVGKQED